jgi:hypothetical protein
MRKAAARVRRAEPTPDSTPLAAAVQSGSVAPRTAPLAAPGESRLTLPEPGVPTNAVPVNPATSVIQRRLHGSTTPLQGSPAAPEPANPSIARQLVSPRRNTAPVIQRVVRRVPTGQGSGSTWTFLGTEDEWDLYEDHQPPEPDESREEMPEVPMEAPVDLRIPRALHHFWAGGPLSEAAIANLLAWQERAREHGWSQTLWSDFGTNSAFKGGAALIPQLFKLREEGVDVREVTELGLAGDYPDIKHPASRAAYRKLQEKVGPGKLRNLPYMSDLARYAALHRFGGVYADVDIHPGSVDLSQTLQHEDPAGEIPFVAPGFRTGADAKEAGYFDDPEKAVETMFDQPSVNNNFIATRPGTEFMSILSRGAAENIEKAGVTNGPIDVIKALLESRGEEEFTKDTLSMIRPPWRHQLRWITDESNRTVD